MKNIEISLFLFLHQNSFIKHKHFTFYDCVTFVFSCVMDERGDENDPLNCEY